MQTEERLSFQRTAMLDRGSDENRNLLDQQQSPAWFLFQLQLHFMTEEQKMEVRVKDDRDRDESPGSSCLTLTSVQSKVQPAAPHNEPSDITGQSHIQTSAASGSSCVSLKSIESPLAFSQEPASSGTKGRKRSFVHEEEQPSCCGLCCDVLKDPVSTNCGHWFCRQCTSSYWDEAASSV
ncbi:E3 ubiquitin-protein ligase TRAF7-like [Poecilia latipinna]|uniref:E3 ubiquitin-protein ligase TRAF7-like n=1 Tax=Poecilia latipinna TaxID=48699 RepID=UPI00072DE0F3|nr:PREDICTED: E3 ubiquitin-protein ligase TRAF7-like [Poecilia latipinna]